jgi:hypothetical protein
VGGDDATGDGEENERELSDLEGLPGESTRLVFRTFSPIASRSMLFTPKTVSVEVRALCGKVLEGGGDPVFVRVKPEGYAKPDDCFLNVEEK